MVGVREQVRLTMFGVDRRERRMVPGLASEQLDGGHAAQVLVEERVQLGELGPHLAEHGAHPHAEDERDHQDERQHREGHREQFDIELRHRDDDADEHEQVAEQGDDAGGEELVEHVHVVRHPRHEPPDRIAVEERDGQALQVAEQVGPQVPHDGLSDALHELRLHVPEPERDGQRRQVDQRDAVEQVQVTVPDAQVDRFLGQEGERQLDGGIGERDEHRESHLQPVGLQVAGDPQHEAPVQRPAGVLLEGAHDASISSSSCWARCSAA